MLLCKNIVEQGCLSSTCMHKTSDSTFEANNHKSNNSPRNPVIMVTGIFNLVKDGTKSGHSSSELESSIWRYLYLRFKGHGAKGVWLAVVYRARDGYGYF